MITGTSSLNFGQALRSGTHPFFQDTNISSNKDNNESIEGCKDNENEAKQEIEDNTNQEGEQINDYDNHCTYGTFEKISSNEEIVNAKSDCHIQQVLIVCL